MKKTQAVYLLNQLAKTLHSDGMEQQAEAINMARELLEAEIKSDQLGTAVKHRNLYQGGRRGNQSLGLTGMLKANL